MKQRSRAWVSMVATVAILGIAAVVAQATNDPTELSCDGEYRAISFSLPTNESVFATPEEAATSFVAGLAGSSTPELPNDVKLVDVTGADTDRATGRQIAAQVDGRSIVIMGITRMNGGWAVGRDYACSG